MIYFNGRIGNNTRPDFECFGGDTKHLPQCLHIVATQQMLLIHLFFNFQQI